jgi:DNA-binding Xre family transcriptional regulator
VRWNLRLAAANRGIWTAGELQRMLATRGLTISAGKMSGLWSGQPASVKLSDLEVICEVLDADPGELLVRERGTVPAAPPAQQERTAVGQQRPPVAPRVPPRRTLPPADL